MFKIKYISSDYLQTTGSALLKMMQNNAMPVLDLFVRESLQNSLDAALPNAKCVNVDYQIGTFNRKNFSSFYDDIEEEINGKFGNNEYKFLSIRDSNTIGLIGNKDGRILKGQNNQNLGKLVFQIMHPQEQEGAGGSWGIGKTVYYRLGKGFTVFYSRIKLDNGDYEERLVSSLVENENSTDSIMNKFNDGIGIAFFGDVDFENKRCSVIIDNEKIHSFLNVFKITPFKNEETGTLVLIPFVDEQYLLNENKYEKKDENETEPFWYQSIEDYLKYSIYRWYFPRLSKNFPNGAYLNASINGKPLQLEEYDYVFKLYEQLYEALITNKATEKIKLEKINRKRDLDNPECGTLAYCKVSCEDLKIIEYHLPSPYSYVNSFDVAGDDSNAPIISFIRKPGMIISYKTEGEWAGNGVSCSSYEYIIGLFVLNSSNKLKSNGLSLEEYIRKGEKSDHVEWVDHALDNGKKYDLVRSITRGITTVLKNEFSEQIEESKEESANRVLGKRMAKLVLPDQNFGKDSTSDGRGRSTTSVANTKLTKVKMSEEVQYDEDGIKLKFPIKSKGNCKSISFIPEIATANGYITLEKWIENDITPDFLFDYLFITISKYDDKSVILNKKISDNSSLDNMFEFEFIKTKGITSSVVITNKNKSSFEFNLALHFIIKNVNSSFVVKSNIEEESK